MKRYILLGKGNWETVFKILAKAIQLETKFGRPVEPLEVGDFSLN